MTDTRLNDTFDDEEGRTISLQEILVPIWQARKRIIWISLSVGVLTYLVNFFLLTVYFKSTATLLPETEKSKLAALGGFADVAQKLLGENIPGSEIARLYPTVLTSETILRSVIERKYLTKQFKDSVNLIQYFELNEDTPEENMDKALRIMRKLVTATTEAKTGIVTITVEMPEPQLAADVLNDMVAELDNFMRLKKVTTATEQVKWIDVRLKEVENELHRAEETLKNFREKNRRINDSPDLLLQQDRLVRDVTVNSTVFVELKKQYELAKLEEIKNISVVNVLDRGRPPVRKERPIRSVNTAIVFFLALLGTSVFYVIDRLYRSKILDLVKQFKS